MKLINPDEIRFVGAPIAPFLAGGSVHYTCSCCGKEVSYPYAKKRWKYCIECGAKMDEEKDE